MEYKIRTYEDVIDVTADRLEVVPDGVRFYTDGRLIASFSRYLWVREQATASQPAAEPAAGQESSAGAAGDGATT